MNHVFHIGVVCIGMAAGAATGQTVQTYGAGSAVKSPDLSTHFDALNRAANGHHLEQFSDGGLRVTTSGNNWVGDGSRDFDPFHGANGSDRSFLFPIEGNNDWVTVETTNLARIYAAEFMYGNGWTTGDIYGPYPWGNHHAVLEWRTYLDGALVSSGQVGPAPLLEMGTIVGFIDRTGFDQLLLRCTIDASGDPDLQALAMDNLNVQITPLPPCPADYNQDGGVDGADVEAFFLDWESGSPLADVNLDGGVDGADVETFFIAWEAGGCN